MKIPRSYIQAYSGALNGVSEQARKSLADALGQVDYSRPVAEVREEVVEIMQRACGASSTMAARLAAEFYDGLRARFGIEDGYQADPDPAYNRDATDGAVRAFAQELVDGDPERFKALCDERIDYEIRRTANESMERNAKRDPRKPKWARVPTGAETCEFCIMLASRGFAYHSEDTASHAHAHCDCRIVPSWDKKGVEGYDPDAYYDLWKRPEKYQSSRNMRKMANSQRRSPFRILNSEEQEHIEAEAKRVGIPRGVLSYNTGFSTSFDEITEKINVRGDVFPDKYSSKNRDTMSEAAVLAHEYYGHMRYSGTSLEPGDWRDEFRASYRAALDAPGLTEKERSDLMIDAYQRAAEAGVTLKYSNDYRRIVYGYEPDSE